MTDLSSAPPRRIPVGVDPNRPSIARVYDGFLGGKDHYAVDRAVMQKVLQAVPEAADIARGNRAFLNRACRFLAAQTDIDQFLDCGSGLPTAEIRRGLGILVEAGILQDEGPAEDPVYRFRHILLREAAYTSALRARRRELHLRIARALQGPGGIAQASPNRVAHHLEHAGLVTESLGWWRAAAAAAAKVAGHREVVSYLRHLPVERHVPPDEFDELKSIARSMGFRHVESGPLVRSSYHAHAQLQ